MLKLEHVKKNYGGFALDCSLEVRPGCITGLIGQNGAGKSTAFKAALGLIRTDGGRVTVLGQNPQDRNWKDRSKIGVVFSDSGFSEYLTVKDVAAILKGFYPSFDQAGFLEQCRRHRLPEDKKLKEFSTGMRAKVKLLAAITHGAELLILDEPTAGLDVMARDRLLDMLRTYMEEDEHRAILISSHISSDLESICDDLYMIQDGKIIFHEETDRLLDSYGVLKVREEQYKNLDKHYLLRVKKEAFGYSVLTDQRQFYLENYPDAVIENGKIDDVITMMAEGESI